MGLTALDPANLSTTSALSNLWRFRSALAGTSSTPVGSEVNHWEGRSQFVTAAAAAETDGDLPESRGECGATLRCAARAVSHCSSSLTRAGQYAGQHVAGTGQPRGKHRYSVNCFVVGGKTARKVSSLVMKE